MKRQTISLLTGTMVVAALLGFAGESAGQAYLATGAEAEVTEDGLHRVDPSIMPAAWVKPDTDLTVYTKILFVPTEVEFRDLSGSSRTARINDFATHFEVDEARQARLRERWGRIFYQEVAAVDAYEQVDEAGTGVLLLQGLLVDVASGVPPDTAGSAATTVMYPWEAIIVLELTDSVSGELVARTATNRRLQGPIDASAVEAVTGTILRRWSRVLCDQLEELARLGAP